MKVVLRSILAETDLEAPPKSLFSEIYSRVCDSLGLKEKWYFGLCYTPDRSTDTVWLETSRKALKKLPTATKNLSFRIKYYPEDVGKELIESITIQIFYMEMKKAILSGDIYCPAETAALLASYSLQGEFGNFNEDRSYRYLLTHHQFLPHRIMNQYNVDPSTWTRSITDIWKKLAGTDPEEAMLEYLKVVQNLDMYGVTYFKIANKKKTKLLLGVSALGMNIYTENDKLTPQLSFSWSEIRKLRFKGRKFIIKLKGEKVPSFVFHTWNKRRSEQIHNLALGNRELYIGRRRADSPEVVVLKEKAAALKALREKNMEKLNLEISYQENFLHRKEEYHSHLQKLQDDLQLTLQKIQQEISEKLEQTKELQKQIEKARRDQEESRIREQTTEAEKLRRRAMLKHETRKEQEQENFNLDLPKVVQVSDKLQEHLKSLRQQLGNSIGEGEETLLDRIHRNNVREKRDKYKTLSDIRGVNCVRRIKLFDNL